MSLWLWQVAVAVAVVVAAAGGGGGGGGIGCVEDDAPDDEVTEATSPTICCNNPA